MDEFIPFNKPYLHGKELLYIQQAVESGKISGDGIFSHKCHAFFEKRYGFKKALLTSSCSSALEMCALLAEVGPGDEVIVPSYTFVTTANAFALRGATLIFADSEQNRPHVDALDCLSRITANTKVLVVMHYAGQSCNMEELEKVCKQSGIVLVEDAAQAIEGQYFNRPLGSIGDLSTFSFHETKNVVCGEGGLLGINNAGFIERAEIIREKGTNRSKFFRGEVDKYTWVDLGSSYLPSEVQAAYLYAQLEQLQLIQEKRERLYATYAELLKPLEQRGLLRLPYCPDYTKQNGHLFYICTKDIEERQEITKFLAKNAVNAVFHYQALHKSPFVTRVLKQDGQVLPNSERFSDTILRLPLFYELSVEKVLRICRLLYSYFGVPFPA